MLEVFTLPDDIVILEPEQQNGDISLEETKWLCNLARESDVWDIFELGTCRGRTALHLAANTRPLSRIYTLDIGDEEPIMRVEDFERSWRTGSPGWIFIKGHPAYQNKISQLIGDSMSFDYSPYEGRMDLVFIDAAHTLEYVLTDTLNALSLLKAKGGYLVWHDWNSPGVQSALSILHQKRVELREVRHIHGVGELEGKLDFLACKVER